MNVRHTLRNIAVGDVGAPLPVWFEQRVRDQKVATESVPDLPWGTWFLWMAASAALGTLLLAGIFGVNLAMGALYIFSMMWMIVAVGRLVVATKSGDETRRQWHDRLVGEVEASLTAHERMDYQDFCQRLAG